MPLDEWVSFVSLLKKEIARFCKVLSQTILSPIINAFLYLLVFGVSFSALLKNQQGFTYLEFLVPGLVALGVLNNALQNSASSVMVSKFHGDLQDLRVIPMTAMPITFAYGLASIARGALVGGCILAISEVVFFFKTGGLISIQHPFMLLSFVFFSGAIFGNVGIWTGFRAKSFDQINVVTTFVVLPLIYLGGVFFSLDILHPVFQTLAHFNPLVYLINGIRFGILGISDIEPFLCLGVSFVFFVISSFFAWHSVKWGSYQRF